MALNIDQQIAVRNRIEKALEKAIDKHNELIRNGRPDSVYRSEIETKILEYLKSMEKLLTRPTLQFEATMKDVNADLKVWEDALDS